MIKFWDYRQTKFNHKNLGLQAENLIIRTGEYRKKIQS
jgi:hypothetical protein